MLIESRKPSQTVLKEFLDYETITQYKWTDKICFHETGQAVVLLFLVHSDDEVMSIFKCWLIP